jgi:hypothetical protein
LVKARTESQLQNCIGALNYLLLGVNCEVSAPWLTEELGPLTDTHKRVISTLKLVRIDVRAQLGWSYGSTAA